MEWQRRCRCSQRVHWLPTWRRGLRQGAGHGRSGLELDRSFYVGANGGYSWGRSRTDVSYYDTATRRAIAPPAGSITNASFDMNGGIAGGQAGYNWQSERQLGVRHRGRPAMVGREGQRRLRLRRRRACRWPLSSRLDVPSRRRRCRQHAADRPEAAMVRGTVRPLSASWRPRRCCFTEPAVWPSARSRRRARWLASNAGGGALASIGSTSTTRAGWTAGVGVEGKITQNWSAKLEYLYMDLGRFSSGPFTLRAGLHDRHQRLVALHRPNPARRHQLSVVVLLALWLRSTEQV